MDTTSRAKAVVTVMLLTTMDTEDIRPSTVCSIGVSQKRRTSMHLRGSFLGSRCSAAVMNKDA